jgi:hypothetical protein
MDASSEPEPKRIERVVLACINCRSRHVKCDATQPICNRCKRDGKECDYQKSRRGGLDKAALARRKMRLRQEAEQTQKDADQEQVESEQLASLELGIRSTNSSQPDNRAFLGNTIAVPITGTQYSDRSPAFQFDTNRLLELFFENFWSSFPIVLPFYHLNQRRSKAHHGMDELILVLQYIGSMYAPWTPSEPYMEMASLALRSPLLGHSPFNVQALTLLALAQYHSNLKQEGQAQLSLAIEIALELRMNQRGFAEAYGESNSVLEESWRRTYYLLNVVDQHFAIFSNTPIYTLANVPNSVDLPCDDEYYVSGLIPPVMTWLEYENREFAEIEIIFSSIVYLYDLNRIVKSIMDMFLETGTFSETMIGHHDTKLAIWRSLLPACKREPLRRDGSIDEVMFTAHMITGSAINGMHRPFSSLALCPDEMNTKGFLPSIMFVAPPKQGRAGHTARVLNAIQLHTKLLATPGTIETHNVLTMGMCARLAITQISACMNLLEDRALNIARDRVRLSIGFLNAMGSIWPLGKLMAGQVRHIARMSLSNSQETVNMELGSMAEIDFPRDDLIWPVDPSAQIDIYSGLMLPVNWETTTFDYSFASSNIK